MSLTTTVIGAYPKPDFLPIPDWFRGAGGPDRAAHTKSWAGAMAALGDEAEDLLERALAQVIDDQVGAGIDIPSDGEIRREDYIHYHCRHLTGIDFERLTEKTLRAGAYTAELPTIRGPIGVRERFLCRDWKAAQRLTERPVKVTMPGPLTIADTTADEHYGDPRRLGEDVADALNAEARELAEAGCVHIQIDEPVFARRVDEALEFGIENLERAFHKLPRGVVRTVHVCCGYPAKLDDPDYPKASPEAYFALASELDHSSMMVVSIEDAHRPNDLALLERFERSTVALGVVAIARSELESVEQIRARLLSALEHIDAARLWAAPDCGLGLLGRDLAREKLANLCRAARSI